MSLSKVPLTACLEANFNMKIGNKGTVFIEAAIVMPLVILITVGMLTVMVKMFIIFETDRQLIHKSKVAAGQESRCTIRYHNENSYSDVKVYINRLPLFSKATATSDKLKIIEESYIVNEKNFVRKADKLLQSFK